MDHPEAGSGLRDLITPVTQWNETSESLNGGEMERKRGMGDMAVCASPGEPQLKRRKVQALEKESLGGILRKAMVDHQLGLSLNLIILLGFTYILFPSLRSTVGPYFWLQYALPSGQFAQGPKDVYLVAGFVIAFTGLRAFCLDYILVPLAGYMGIRKQKGKIRFAEQSYLLLYYVVYWTWGVYIFVQDTPSSNATSTRGFINDLLVSFWKDFPRLTHEPSMKLYYLSQTAFWVQQIFVINIEERRKDHWQMFTHHIVTVGLLVFSYGFRQMRCGNAVLVLMDVVDLIFPLAKILRYLGCQTACDMAFGLFVVLWLVARHFCYITVCWAVNAHLGNPAVMPYGTYSTITSMRISPDGGENVLDNLLQPLLNPSARTVGFNSGIKWVFLGLLLGLQAITLAWFVMICRVVARVLRGEGADDSRSDDEDAEDEEMPTPNGAAYKSRQAHSQAQATAGAERPRFIEVAASSEDFTYTSRHSNANGSKGNANNKRKSKGISSSGLNLGEHKEILNRIGCLSEEQLARERERREAKDSRSMSPRPGSAGWRR